MYAVGSEARAACFEAVVREMPQQRFRHLAARRIVGTQEEHPGFLRSHIASAKRPLLVESAMQVRAF